MPVQEKGCHLGGGPPLPRPPGGCPRPLAPGARVTGSLAFGLDEARLTSFCRSTPFPAAPPLVLVGFPSGSLGFSAQTTKKGQEVGLSLFLESHSGTKLDWILTRLRRGRRGQGAIGQQVLQVLHHLVGAVCVVSSVLLFISSLSTEKSEKT